MKYFLDAVEIRQKCNDSFGAKMPVMQHFFPCSAKNSKCKTQTVLPFFDEYVGL